jgi:hypothetical protein
MGAARPGFVGSVRAAAFACVVALGFGHGSAQAELPAEETIAPYLLMEDHAKFALIVGVSQYITQPKVVSVQADVALVEAAFADAGFDVAPVVIDPDLATWVAAVRDFKARIQANANGRGAYAVVFFAGHGIKDASHQGYLLPREFDGTKPPVDSALTVEWVMDELDIPEVALRLAFIDACRTVYDLANPASIPAGRTIDANLQSYTGAQVVFSTQANRLSYSPTADGATSHFSRGVASLLAKQDKDLADGIIELVDLVQTASQGAHQQSPLALGSPGTLSLRPGPTKRAAQLREWREALLTDDTCSIDRYARLHRAWVTHPGMAKWRLEKSPLLAGRCNTYNDSAGAVVTRVEAVPTSGELPVLNASLGRPMALYSHPSASAGRTVMLRAKNVVVEDLGQGWARVMTDGVSRGFARWNRELLPEAATPQPWQLGDARPVARERFSAGEYASWESTRFGVTTPRTACAGAGHDLLKCLADRQRPVRLVKTATVADLCGATPVESCTALLDWAGLGTDKPVELRVVAVAGDTADSVLAYEQAFEQGLAVRLALQARKSAQDDVSLTVQPAAWAKGRPEDAALIGQITLRSESALPVSELQELSQ